MNENWLTGIIGGLSTAFASYTTNQTNLDIARINAKAAQQRNSGMLGSLASIIPLVLIGGGVLLIFFLFMGRKK